MNLAALKERRVTEYRALSDMVGPLFGFEAYKTTADLDRRVNAVGLGDASEASKYVFTLRVPTLAGPGQYVNETVIGVDTAVSDYPMKPPNTWVVSTPIPWSPHFKEGYPVCIGPEFWEPRRGHVLVAHLVVHLCRLLNWDEEGRGSGYVGWNGEAIAYHRKHVGGPLDAGLAYPALPKWLFGEEAELVFQPLRGGFDLLFDRVS